MRLKKLLFSFNILLLTGCTYTVPIKYTGDQEVRADAKPNIGKIIIVDSRGVDRNLLGIVRGSFGNEKIIMRTDKPIDKVVESVYRQSLESNGFINDNGEPPLIFKSDIKSFYSTYGLTPFYYDASVVIKVSLVDSQTGKTIFQSPYRSEVEEWDWGRGFTIFISEEVLRDIAEEALNYTVEKTISDPEFIKVLNYTRDEIAEAGNSQTKYSSPDKGEDEYYAPQDEVDSLDEGEFEYYAPQD